MNTGDSDIRRRMINAAMVTKTDEKNTRRQPQFITSSSGHSWTRIQMTAPSAVPAAAPTKTSDERRPRLPFAAVSVRSTMPPACSAPAPKP